MLRYDLEDFSCEKLVRSVFFVDLYNCETNYNLSEHISDLPIGSSFNGVNPEKDRMSVNFTFLLGVRKFYLQQIKHNASNLIHYLLKSFINKSIGI